MSTNSYPNFCRWWKYNDMGYSEFLSEAKLFDYGEAKEIIDSQHGEYGKYEMYDSEYVLSKMRCVIDGEDLDSNLPSDLDNPQKYHKEWRVGRFQSSSTPGKEVLCLATTPSEMETWSSRSDFIRWED